MRATHSSTPPTIAPTRFAPKARSAASLRLNENVKTRLAKKTGAKAIAEPRT